MTCLEAQSNIIAYIEGNLLKDTRIDFLKHIKSCDNCREELDIYYTMIEGMHQMDCNLPISRDFSAELNLRIDRELKQEKKKKEFVHSSLVIIVVGIIGFAIAGYANYLNVLYEDEQNTIKEQQGEYYYSDNFDDVLFEPENRLMSINVEPEENEDETFYEKVREYNAISTLH